MATMLMPILDPTPGKGLSALIPSVPPMILVASMTLISIRGMISVTTEKYMPLKRRAGKTSMVEIVPPRKVAIGIVR